ncbi:MAG TPA: TetR/AcrR family transcriptional regulator [Burkholderiales bacterium]|nr:TetR/AcrR family transcriptional regulator [Burkholderiales bacterium]
MFERRGYHGATTQDIAEELGIRQATLYYYFRSKEAALEQVCLLGVEIYVQRAEAIAARKASASERLRALIHNHLAPLSDQPAYVRVFIRERRYLPDDARHKVGKLARRYETVFESVIKDGIKAGDFRRDAQPRLTALAVLGMCNAGTAWFGRDPKVTPAMLVDEFAKFALEGLRATR